MTLDFSTDVEVIVTMIPYITECVTLFLQHDNSDKTIATPSVKHMLQVDDSTTHISPNQATVFHHFTAKCLFLTKSSRPDISPTVDFLPTIVRAPDTDDWKNRVCLIHYIRGTIDIPLILSDDLASIPKWWVNGLHAVHPNLQGHYGGCISLRRGMPISTSTKKLNNWSSARI